MAKPAGYERIPGSLRSPFSRASLWASTEHLLSISGSVYAERYQRFEWSEIQALVIRDAARWTAPAWLYAVGLTWLIAIPVLRFRWPAIPSSFAFVMPVLLVLWMTYAALFRSCRVDLYTATGRHPLLSLHERATALRAIEAIGQRAEAAQGSLAPGWSQTGFRSVFARSGVQTFDEYPPLLPAALRIALAAFSLMIVDGLFDVWALGGRLPRWAEVFDSLDVLAMAGCFLVLLVLLRRNPETRSLRRLTIGSVLFAGTAIYLQAVLTGFTAAFRQAGTGAYGRWFSLSGNLILGVIGVGLTLSHRTSGEEPASSFAEALRNPGENH